MADKETVDTETIAAKAAKVNRKFENVTKAAKKVIDLGEKMESADTVTTEMQSNLIDVVDQILAQNVLSVGKSLANVKNFVLKNAKGTKISKNICDEMLKDLKQLEAQLENEVVKTGDQSIAQMATQQVKLLKKTWQVIGESCQLSDEAKEKKIPKINEQLEKMESKCVVINKLINAYNNPEEKRKKVILKRINDEYQLLRTDYIRTRKEIDSLKLTIDGQIVELDFVDSLHTDSMIQNGALAVASIIQGFTAKGSVVVATKNVTAAASNFTQSLDAKTKIARTRQDLNELRDEINKLEIRLAAVREIKEKAEQLLRENGIKIEDD